MQSNANAVFAFNPTPSVRIVPVGPGRMCVVLDHVLDDPEGMVEWAASQTFTPARGNQYPGVVVDVPEELSQRVGDCFAQHARSRLGARRTQGVSVRLSLVTQSPATLAPVQWQCHRDRIADDPQQTMFAASVLYLFRNRSLGGTSFYQPKQPPAETDRLMADAVSLSAEQFSARYGLRAGYMRGSNDYFERVARVGAAWNRMIFYDGGQFHSGDIDPTAGMIADPRSGRLTLNGFFVCRRNAAG